jgi:hypothetical protein
MDNSSGKKLCPSIRSNSRLRSLSAHTGREFSDYKSRIKRGEIFRLEKLTFLRPVPQWGEKDTDMRGFPTHYPATSPRKLQTFLAPVFPMAISNLPGFANATQSS